MSSMLEKVPWTAEKYVYFILLDGMCCKCLWGPSDLWYHLMVMFLCLLFSFRICLMVRVGLWSHPYYCMAFICGFISSSLCFTKYALPMIITSNILLLDWSLASMKGPYSSILANFSLKSIVYYIKAVMPAYLLVPFTWNTTLHPFHSNPDDEVCISGAVKRRMLFSGPVCWTMSFDWAIETIYYSGILLEVVY